MFYISLHRHLVDNICGDNFNLVSFIDGLVSLWVFNFERHGQFYTYIFCWKFCVSLLLNFIVPFCYCDCVKCMRCWHFFFICQMFVSLVNPILHWLLVMVRFLVFCVSVKAKLKDWHHFRCWDCKACSYIRSNCILRTTQLFNLD